MASRSTVSDIESDSNESDNISCCSESTYSSSESESSPQRPVVRKEEKFVKKELLKLGSGTESHGHRSKHGKIKKTSQSLSSVTINIRQRRQTQRKVGNTNATII